MALQMLYLGEKVDERIFNSFVLFYVKFMNMLVSSSRCFDEISVKGNIQKFE